MSGNSNAPRHAAPKQSRTRRMSAEAAAERKKKAEKPARRYSDAVPEKRHRFVEERTEKASQKICRPSPEKTERAAGSPPVREKKPDLKETTVQNARARRTRTSSDNRRTRTSAGHSPGASGKKNLEALKYIYTLIPALFLLFAVVLIVRGNSGGAGVQRHTADEIAEGVEYIRTLESTDITPVQETISSKETISEIESLENGDVSVWSQFSDAVVIGDSRAIGFSYYDLLPEERVLAHYGAYLYEIEDYYLDSLVQLNPKYVFIAIGINDIGNGVWATDEAFANAFGDVMDTIQAYLPNAVIACNSVLTCVEPALSDAAMWYEIPSFNEKLEIMCEERGYPYIDNSPLCEELSYLYEPDGIHVQYDFYEPWALNMIKGVVNFYE